MIGVEGNSVPSLWNMETDGVCIGGFSTRHFGARRSTGSYPCNIARCASYYGGSGIVRNNSLITYSSMSSTTNPSMKLMPIPAPCRYTASVILNSVYDYEPKSQKDDLFEIITKTLKVTGRALRPDVSILVGAFPASE